MQKVEGVLLMSRFEEIGASFQQNSCSIEQANRRFEQTCNKCCMLGLRIDCEACGVAYANKHFIETVKRVKAVLA